MPQQWKRYVAIGDSFTEGLWDPDEQAEPPVGWADRLAAHLDVESYANLAIRGRLLEPIIKDQLERALSLSPDLISIVGGGNNMLRPGADPDRLARILESGVIKAREAGADVLLATSTDTRGVLLMSRMRPTVAQFNTNIWSIARRHGAYVTDLWGLRSIYDWRVWAPDRIHFNSEGHRRVANAALVALGLPPYDPDWDVPLPAADPETLATRASGHLQWLRRDVAPWATRRLRRTSSGHEKVAKRPDLTPLRPTSD